jgi:two-component system, LuxR family, sensor histidine kinase DctS
MDATRAARRPLRAWFTRRRLLWASLVVLVLLLLTTLVWLAGRYEDSQMQSRLESNAAQAVIDVRSALTRNVQSLQALATPGKPIAELTPAALDVLRDHREIVRLEWRNSQLTLLSAVDSPYQRLLFGYWSRANSFSDVQQACAMARRLNGPAYSGSHFQPQASGAGQELLEMCLPVSEGGEVQAYLVATYTLPGMLTELIGPALSRGQLLSFTEADGTRLAVQGAAQEGSRAFTAQQLIDLPGHTMVLRMDTKRNARDLFPNVLTALVAIFSIALISVLVLLARDVERRLQAERGLAEALAFRKAMEDSLVTGLRARDLQGRITYVNPAFCQMTGLTSAELLGASSPMPYWPPELIDEYQQRQAVRLAGNLSSREGYESVFVRKGGQQFPVFIIEAPLINAEQVQTGWMSAILDMTDQRQMEELSRASQERLQASARLATVGEMASLLSHELNQPLAAISSYATGSLNMLRSHPALRVDDMAHAMHRIAEQAERAGKVIKSVHDFVRRRDQAHETVAPLALLEAIMPLVSLQARKLGIRVKLQCAQDLPRVLCDRTMVEQVLLNLARNAMQAMEHTPAPARKLTLGAHLSTGLPADLSPTAPWISFSVEDSGQGIDADTAARLFTPFFTTKPEGMGLGLSLCRTVVEQHGGALSFAPRVPRGTVFSFSLPTAGDSAALLETSQGGSPCNPL